MYHGHFPFSQLGSHDLRLRVGELCCSKHYCTNLTGVPRWLPSVLRIMMATEVYKMRTIRNLLLTGIVTMLCCSIGKAQNIIYSNAFTGGGVTLNGTTPTVANSMLGGSSSSTWTCTFTNNIGSATVFANGAIDTNASCALLPFTPQPGCVYFMTASLTIPASMPNWVAMGFAQFATQTNNATGIYSRFTDNPPGGYAWMGVRANTVPGVYGGRGTGSPLGNTTVIPAGTNNLSIVLNTVGSQWVLSAYLGGTISGTSIVGGTQMGTNFLYTANPPIAYAGIGQTTFAGQSVAGIQWNYWTLCVTQVLTMPVTSTYWVGPSASGTGDGSSSANAAGFLNYSFWTNVQSQLKSADINVNLEDGNYYAGTLNFTNIGNPVHRLTLQAVDLYKPVFTGAMGTLIYITGSQNIKFYGIVFSGPASYWGIECVPNGLIPCRNLEFSYCQLINLTNVLYGALGLVNGARDILVDNCTFTNLTANNGNHQHMIYASHNIVGVVATNCLFQDCLADYLRFRDNSEYCTVENCTFISTMSASAWPFISAELYNVTNSDSAGDEFFGTHFQVTSNLFVYNVAGGPGPYAALHFSDTGFSPYSYDCDLTNAQANELGSGNVGFQQSFLQTNLGINASDIKMFGNNYNSQVAYAVDYTYNWDGIQPNGGWSGTVNISGVPDSSGALLGPTPALRNGNFDRQGLLLTPVVSSTPNQCLFQTWFCNPKYTTVLSHAGFNGTSNALMFNKTATQYVYQWITPPGPTWTMDFLFAMDSTFTGTGIKFKVDIFHNDISGSKVSVGFNDQGQFGIYNNGGGFMNLPELGTVSISTNNVYRMRIVGNFAASTPYVNIYTSDANNPTLTHQSLRLTDWINGTPVGGLSSPETIALYNYTSTVIVDQVALVAGLGEQPPVITNALINNGQFILSGTNGFDGDNYYLLSSTNLALGNWAMEATNAFDATGSFSITNTVAPGAPQKFYRLQLQ
jgi:hypothetical protein